MATAAAAEEAVATAARAVGGERRLAALGRARHDQPRRTPRGTKCEQTKTDRHGQWRGQGQRMGKEEGGRWKGGVQTGKDEPRAHALP